MHASLHSQAQHLLVMFFQPFVPPLLMAWLWVINVRHWELNRIDYEACFSSRDRKMLPSHTDLYKVGHAALRAWQLLDDPALPLLMSQACKPSLPDEQQGRFL
jgi:hypothetical protein